MHMADAMITPAVSCVMYTASAGATAYSIHKLKNENKPERIAVMGVMGAFTFAAQMINFTIPGTGSSGHICGSMLLTALLGPYAAFLTMIGVLLIQCLLFGDGGILALGCNIWNMAFYGCFVGALLIWQPIMKSRMNRTRIFIASVLGCILTLQLGAFSVTLETTASQITSLPFRAFVLTMQPIHLAIGLVEGLITAAILIFIYEARPKLLYCSNFSPEEKKARLSIKSTLAILLITAIAIGGGLSLVASAKPDGLEWSIEQLTGSTEVENDGDIYDSAQKTQDTVAILPDYSFKGSDSPLGTSASGIIGGLLVTGLCVGASYGVRIINRKRQKNEKYSEGSQ